MPIPCFIAAGNHVRGLVDAMGPMLSPIIAIDQFCDRDTCAGIQGHRLLTKLDEIADCIQEFSDAKQPVPVFWAGGTENLGELYRQTENNPGVVSLGHCSSSIRRIRDPFFLHEVLSDNRLPALPLLRSPPQTGANDWLCKPFASGGGFDIKRLSPGLSSPADKTFYFQKFSPGRIYGASLTGCEGRAELHGVCEHLDSTSRTMPFRYEGSVGPVDADATVLDWLINVGNLLVAEFGLCGWFGIDFAFEAEHGQCWLLEVNPRFTFSMELIDRRYPGLLLRQHLAAFRNSFDAGQWPAKLPESGSNMLTCTNSQIVHAARILYNDSDRPIRIGNEIAGFLWSRNRSADRSICDVPWPETLIQRGQPICTAFSSGKSVGEAKLNLDQTAISVFERIRSENDLAHRIVEP